MFGQSWCGKCWQATKPFRWIFFDLLKGLGSPYDRHFWWSIWVRCQMARVISDHSCVPWFFMILVERMMEHIRMILWRFLAQSWDIYSPRQIVERPDMIWPDTLHLLHMQAAATSRHGLFTIWRVRAFVWRVRAFDIISSISFHRISSSFTSCDLTERSLCW